MAEKSGTAAQKVTPQDAQKGAQGALSEAHPDIPLKQDAPLTGDLPTPSNEVSNGLTHDQISLLCDVEERDLSKLPTDKKHDLERLLSEGYVAPAENRAASHFKLTPKGSDLLGKRGAGLNEA